MPADPEPRKLIVSVFPTFALGGGQVRFATLAGAFGSLYRHAIISMDGNMACRARLPDHLDVSFPEPEIRKGQTIGNVRRFRRLLQELQPDVLLTSNWGSLEWAIANTPPLVKHVHVEDGFGPEECITQLPRRIWARRIFLRRSTVVLPSRTLWRTATEVWRLDPRRLRYIPNGIDLLPLPRETPPAPLPGTVPVVGTVAALRAEKNLARLLNAFSTVVRDHPARLVIVGDGAEGPSLRALAEKLGLHGLVQFVGQVENPRNLYRAFDVCALTSDTEQMPFSVLEAMAAGLPIAATDVGDVRLMLDAANHPFVVPCDDAAFAAVLARLIADPALRRRLGEANRAKVARDYDQRDMIKAWHGVLHGPGTTWG